MAPTLAQPLQASIASPHAIASRQPLGTTHATAAELARSRTSRASLAIAMTLWLASGALSQEPGGRKPAPAASVAAATVRITNPAGRFLGCGVVVAVEELGFRVLTAEHIVRASPQLIVECVMPDKSTASSQLEQPSQLARHSSVQVLAQDSRADLALLRVQSGIPPAGQLRPSAPDARDQFAAPFEAWVVDWTTLDAVKTRTVQVVQRRLARRSPSEPPVSFWQVAEPSRSGMSGGGLVSSAGQLLGIASGNSGDHAYYSDEREIAKFLAGVER